MVNLTEKGCFNYAKIRVPNDKVQYWRGTGSVPGLGRPVYKSDFGRGLGTVTGPTSLLKNCDRDRDQRGFGIAVITLPAPSGGNFPSPFHPISFHSFKKN